jgi:hypothetical protein
MAEEIKISKFTFWLITSIIGVGMVGFSTWATYMSQAIVSQQVSMAEMKMMTEQMSIRLKENYESSNKIYELESVVRSLRVVVDANSVDLASKRGAVFNMSEYDRYVKPVQDDLLQRVIRIEARMDNK